MKKSLPLFLAGAILIFIFSFIFSKRSGLQKSIGKKAGVGADDRINDACNEGYIFSRKDCRCISDPNGCKNLDKVTCEKNSNCYSFSRSGTCSCPNCEIWFGHQCLPKEN